MPFIVVGDTIKETSLEPIATSTAHDHEELQMDDSLLQDGHMTLIADPPKDNKFISCQKGAANEQFSVDTNGGLVAQTIVSELGIETKDDGALKHIYSNSTGELLWKTRQYW